MEPVRCFTCNAVLHFKRYEELTRQASTSLPAFEAMQVARFCCRRMYLSHPVELEEHLRSYPLRNMRHADYSVSFETEAVCEVSTD